MKLRELETKLTMARLNRRVEITREHSTGPLITMVLNKRMERGYIATWKKRIRSTTSMTSTPGAPRAKRVVIDVVLRTTPTGELSLKSIRCLQEPSGQIQSRPLTSLWASHSADSMFTRLLSTPQGVMTDHEARKQGYGGRPLLRVK